MLNTPPRHSHRVFQPLFVFLPKLEKGQNCLSYRVDVDGVSAVRIVLRSAVSEKHALLPKAITSEHSFVEFIGLQVLSNPFQCYQHETRVEVIHPAFIGHDSIGPGSIRQLTPRCEAGGRQCRLTQMRLTGLLEYGS